MTLAHGLGWPLGRVMSLNEREYMLWQAWLRSAWNKPTRADHYVMQVAQELKIARTRKRQRLDGMKIPFKFVQAGQTQEQPVMTVEEATALSKARWGARLGVPIGAQKGK